MREGATAGAMRIELISNSQTRRNRYISRRLLSIASSLVSPDTPRYLSRREDEDRRNEDEGQRVARVGEGRERVRRSYVDERAHEDTPSSNRCRKDQF